MNLLYALEGIRTPFLNKLMLLMTECGGEMVFMALAIIVFWCFSKYCGYYMLTVGFTGTVVNQFLKLVFRIPRPWVKDPNFQIVEEARAAATGYSFPSGHTQNVFNTFGVGFAWTKKVWLKIVCAVVIVLTAFSRMYLGVHTPLDVGVSFLCGLLLVIVLYPVFRHMEEHPNRMYIVFAVMFVLDIVLLVYSNSLKSVAGIDPDNLSEGVKNSFTLMGAILGMTVAYTIDLKHTHFDVKAVWWAQIIKVVLGLVITIGLRVVLKYPLIALVGHEGVANCIRYFIMVLFAGGIWPMTFKWFGKMGRK